MTPLGNRVTGYGHSSPCYGKPKRIADKVTGKNEGIELSWRINRFDGKEEDRGYFEAQGGKSLVRTNMAWALHIWGVGQEMKLVRTSTASQVRLLTGNRIGYRRCHISEGPKF